MPFTVSHAAAVLPFFRFSRRISRSGLVIGTMVPDLPLFLDFGRYDLSHSAAGILVFNLPVGLLLWLIWHHWMREASKGMCPAPLRTAVFDYDPESGPRPWTVYLSLCIGAATHIFWDGFTHYTGFGTALFPILYSSIFGLPVFSWLQFLGSALGGGALVLWLGHRWQPGSDTKTALLSCAGWASMIVLSVILAALLNKNHGVLYIYGTIIASMQVFFGGWLAVCLLWNLRQKSIRTTQYAYQKSRNWH